MDKFLVKVESEEPPSVTPGLEFLVNPLRHKRRTEVVPSDPDYGNISPQFFEQNMERFKSLMQQRILEFKPHFYSDPIDYLIECIWFHFLFHDTAPPLQPANIAEYRKDRDKNDIDLISNISR